jgi:protein-S-isoprenylcysteine O-methyltransferase Ste14
LIDDRTARVVVIVAAHAIFLSGFALRLLRGERRHLVRAGAPWWLQYAPPLVWIPWVVAIGVPFGHIALSDAVRLLGLVLAVAGALFAAWSMWALGRQYAIGMDLFEGHRLVRGGPYAIVRHPMYLGILVHHVGAALLLSDVLLLVFTVALVLPYLALRLATEEMVLRHGLPEYVAYESRVPPLLPFSRP